MSVRRNIVNVPLSCHLPSFFLVNRCLLRYKPWYSCRTANAYHNANNICDRSSLAIYSSAFSSVPKEIRTYTSRSTAQVLANNTSTKSPFIPTLPPWATTPRPSICLDSSPRIAIFGAPGSGKTKVTYELSQILQLPSIDVDDDLLEGRWKCSVSEKLQLLGDEMFIREEANEILSLLDSFPSQISNDPTKIVVSPFMSIDIRDGCILSLSGSSVLLPEVTEALIRHRFVLVYLECPYEIISKRLSHMKVDRIVGQATKTLSTILGERFHIYENCYDIRIPITDSSTPSSVAETVSDYLGINENFCSTRGWNHRKENYVDMLEVIRRGLAPDGGLFTVNFAQCKPFNYTDLQRWTSLSYPEIVLRVLERMPLGSLRPSYLRYMLHSAYSTFTDPKVLPVHQLIDNLYLMETYHGPTASFKDLSLQLLPKLINTAMNFRDLDGSTDNSNRTKDDEDEIKLGLLVATSGDTGTAALNGFAAEGNTPIVVLFPDGGVSEIQKAQMQTAEGNVCILGVKADFDFCQDVVKELLGTDQSFHQNLKAIFPKMQLSSANSINWGRFLPQIAFTIAAYIRLEEDKVIYCGEQIDICIPTGNFGNLLGAVFARKLGLPIRNLICASNSNNILTEFIQTGIYDCSNRKFHLTASPSIDILISSNLERFLYLLSDDHVYIRRLFEDFSKMAKFQISKQLLSRVQNELKAGWCNEEQCLETIREMYVLTGKFIDPHTAIAVHVAKQHNDPDVPMLISSTADFGKFPSTMIQAVGQSVCTGVSDQQLITESIPYALDGTVDNATMGLIQLLNTLLSIPHHPQSKINPNLIDLTIRKRLHSEIIEPDRDAIRYRIIDFFKSLKSNASELERD